MKNTLRLTAAALFAALVPGALPTHAFVSDDAQHVEIFAGYVSSGDASGSITASSFTGSLEPDDSMIFGLRAGSNFTDHWGFEFSLSYASSWDLDFVSGGAVVESRSGRYFALDASVGYYTQPFKKATGFFYAGPSFQSAKFDAGAAAPWNEADGLGVHAGISFQAFILPRGGYLRADVRYRYLDSFFEFDSSKSLGVAEGTVSAGFVF